LIAPVITKKDQVDGVIILVFHLVVREAIGKNAVVVNNTDIPASIVQRLHLVKIPSRSRQIPSQIAAAPTPQMDESFSHATFDLNVDLNLDY